MPIEMPAGGSPLSEAEIEAAHTRADALEPFEITVSQALPEAGQATFTTTGPEGGDAGHGGIAELTFRMAEGVHGIKLIVYDGDDDTDDKPREVFADDMSIFDVTVSAQGDWELVGLEELIVMLAAPLRRRLAAYHNVKLEDLETFLEAKATGDLEPDDDAA
jgi:hypothetical protein